MRLNIKKIIYNLKKIVFSLKKIALGLRKINSINLNFFLINTFLFFFFLPYIRVVLH